MASKKKKVSPVVSSDFESLVTKIVQIHDRAQDFSTKAVNIGLTLRNWLIGHRIVEFEQNGKDRATYGERLLPKLAQRLVNAGLKRVDARELRRFRLLYTVYPQIRETVSPELLAQAKMEPRHFDHSCIWPRWQNGSQCLPNLKWWSQCLHNCLQSIPTSSNGSPSRTS